MTETLSYWMDEVEDMVIPAKSNRDDKEVTEKEKKVSNTKSGKEVIENVMHGPEKEKLRLLMNNFLN